MSALLFIVGVSACGAAVWAVLAYCAGDGPLVGNDDSYREEFELMNQEMEQAR